MQYFNSGWIAVTFGLIVLTIPSVAKANDSDLCFMVTSSGKKVSLGQLCQVTQPTVTQTAFRIPIKRRQAKTPIIDVKFNGKNVFEMVFDTGASGILITQEMAKTLNVKSVGTVKSSIADGSIVEFGTGIMPSVSVGGLQLQNQQVAIAPKAEIGLLGHGFFEKYDITILDKYIEFRQR